MLEYTLKFKPFICYLYDSIVRETEMENFCPQLKLPVEMQVVRISYKMLLQQDSNEDKNDRELR